MAPAKTLYVREGDMPIWEKAETLAQASKQSVSQIVTAALRGYLAGLDEPAADEITVSVGNHRTGDEWDEQFIGRWLVEPDPNDTRTGEEGYDRGAYWGMALTKRGRIAVYVAHCNGRWPGRLNDYDDLDTAASNNVPADIIAMAANALGQSKPIRRNI